MSKYAIEISPTGEQKLVNAFGEEVPFQDADKLTLLVIPELYLPIKCIATNELDLSKIHLFFSCPELNIISKKGFTLRRPYLNGDFIVAGTEDTVMGWFSDLPSSIKRLTFIYDWKFDEDSLMVRETEVVSLLHKVEIELEKTDRGQVFSTMVPFFEKDKNKLTSVISSKNFKKFMGNNNDEKHCFSKSRLKFDYYQVELLSSVKLSSCALSDLAYFLEFNDNLTSRERVQKATFETGVKKHRAAASCSMPPFIFIEAVKLARLISFEDSNCKDEESHPALLLLSSWWNNNAPRNRVAASLMPWVRTSEELLYQCGYWENPGDISIDCFSPEFTASCGDSILMFFLKSRSTAYYDKNGDVVLDHVGGEVYEVAGSDLEEYFPAWYSLQALAYFPQRFTSAWAALKND